MQWEQECGCWNDQATSVNIWPLLKGSCKTAKWSRPLLTFILDEKPGTHSSHLCHSSSEGKEPASKLLLPSPHSSSKIQKKLGFAGLCWAWSLCCNTNRAVSGTLPLGFCFSSLPNLWARPSPCLLRQAVGWEHLTVCRDELVEPHAPQQDNCGEMLLTGGDAANQGKENWVLAILASWIPQTNLKDLAELNYIFKQLL